MKTLKLSAAAVLIAAAAGTAAAGPDYQNLKDCLAHCINTTEPLTWARFWCVTDCYADYVDSKLSLSARINPDSTGYAVENGQRYLDWAGQAAGLVSVQINATPTNAPIELVELSLMNNAFPPETGGMPLGAFPMGGQPRGVALINFPIPPTVEGGLLVAKIRYVGNDDIDDVAVIPVITRDLADPCPADFNGDNVVDFFDYLDFVGAFSEGC